MVIQLHFLFDCNWFIVIIDCVLYNEVQDKVQLTLLEAFIFISFIFHFHEKAKEHKLFMILATDIIIEDECSAKWQDVGQYVRVLYKGDLSSMKT